MNQPAVKNKQVIVASKLRNVLASASHKYMNVLPKYLTADRMVQIAMNASANTAKLLDCTPESFALAVMNACQCGLEPDGYHGHLIPYGRTCQFIPDYKGLVQLALKNGVVIDAYAVYENDKFEYQLGTKPNITHYPCLDGNRGELRCSYAVAHFPDGATKFVVASKDDILKRKGASASSSKSDSPWNKWEDEMYIKGLDVDTPIPTPDGWSPIGELEVGDVVFDMDGEQVAVTAVSEVKVLPCYRVTFTDGEEIICDDDHRWVAKCGGSNLFRQDFGVVSIGDMYRAKQDGMSVMVPVCGCLSLDQRDLPVDPYILGYWLGDGSTGKASITCHIDDLESLRRNITIAGYGVGAVRSDDRSCTVCVGITGGLQCGLRELGVLNEKHVPQEYMRGSEQQRRAILQGLVDSDGHITKARGHAEFTNKNYGLALSVAELVSSLGDVPCIKAVRRSGFGVEGTYFLVRWKSSFCCCRLQRKIDNYTERKVQKYRSIRSIEIVQPVPTKCISVDSRTNTYLAGMSMVPTHNTAVKMLMKFLPRTANDQLTMSVRADDAAEIGKQLPPDALASGNFNAGHITSNTDDLVADMLPDVDEDAPPADQFATIAHTLNSEQEVLQLFDIVIEKNAKKIGEDEYNRAVELRDVRIAMINGELL